jgi:hypothetical protein
VPRCPGRRATRSRWISKRRWPLQPSSPTPLPALWSPCRTGALPRRGCLPCPQQRRRLAIVVEVAHVPGTAAAARLTHRATRCAGGASLSALHRVVRQPRARLETHRSAWMLSCVGKPAPARVWSPRPIRQPPRRHASTHDAHMSAYAPGHAAPRLQHTHTPPPRTPRRQQSSGVARASTSASTCCASWCRMQSALTLPLSWRRS